MSVGARLSRPVAHIVFSGVGGLPTSCLNLAIAAKKDSEQVIAWYGNEPLADQHRVACETNQIPYKYFLKKPGLDLLTQIEIGRWLKEMNPCSIVCHAPASLFCGIYLKYFSGDTKVIGVEHHSNALKGLKEWILSALAPLVSDHMVYLSNEYLNQVEKKLPFLKFVKKRTVIPNGLDLSKFQFPATSVPGLVGMQGRMVTGKDYETLIRAFAGLGSGFSLSLIGDGPDRARLEQICIELRIESRVVFHGTLSNAEVIEQMSQWECFVLSTYGETMSVAIMEAHALGLPVVASAVSGVTSAVENNVTGLLFEVGNAEALLEKLKDVLHDSKSRQNLSMAARQRAENCYSIDRSWAQFRTIIEGR